MGLKYVVYRAEDESVADIESDVRRNLSEINRIWGQCGIAFQIDEFLAVSPAEHQLRYRTANYQELNQIRRTFENDHTLLIVTTGPWDRSGSIGNTWANAWTNLPDEGLHGAVLESNVRTYPNIIAHEIGHYLNLMHSGSQTDVMHPRIFPESVELQGSECSTARATARRYWSKMLR